MVWVAIVARKSVFSTCEYMCAWGSIVKSVIELFGVVGALVLLTIVSKLDPKVFDRAVGDAS